MILQTETSQIKTVSGEDIIILLNKARLLLSAFCGRAVLWCHEEPVHGGSMKPGQLMVCSFMRFILPTSYLNDYKKHCTSPHKNEEDAILILFTAKIKDSFESNNPLTTLNSHFCPFSLAGTSTSSYFWSHVESNSQSHLSWTFLVVNAFVFLNGYIR